MNHSGVLKDLNFLEISKAVGSKLLNLRSDQSEDYLSILEADSKFLVNHSLMDYSLLLVIETDPQDGSQFYHMGIIDYLQNWDTSKMVERYFKTFLNRSIAKKISAMPSAPYRFRFMQFLRNNVLKS